MLKSRIKKGNAISRLFTYAKLQKVLKEKSLTHVRLPNKMLLIKDKLAKKYLRGQPAIDVIDSMMRLIAFKINPLTVKIDYESPREIVETDEWGKEFAKEMGWK